VLADNQEDRRVVRIICVLLLAVALTISVLVPSAAARACYVDGAGPGGFVACGEPQTGLAGSAWTWAFVAGWASMVALLLLTERCARRKELEASMRGAVSPLLGSSRPAS
jgi:hypothetical protein